nr:MAG TPA: restriction enzyme [Caudoviricetes sp.]
MGKKLEDSVIVNLFESKGYKIVGEIKNTTTPILCEKDGYRYKITYNNLKMGKTPSFWGFNNIINLDYNIRVFLHKKSATAEFLHYNIIAKNQKKRILLTFRCECGEIFNKTLEDTIYKTYICCNKCTIEKSRKKKRVSEKSLQKIKQAGYTVLQSPENLRITDLCEVEDGLGFRGFISSASVSAHKGMSKFDVRINKKNYIYNVNHWAELNCVDTRCLGFEENTHYKRQGLRFCCSCGREFVTSIASFQNGKIRCSECAKSISKYEFIFKSYLEKEHIDFIYQYSLNQCRDILPLPFDFYIKEYYCLIEVDGEGHYYPCHFNRISYERAVETFNITKRHDAVKNNFCQNNDIPLLRIPYWEFKDDTFKQTYQKFIEKLTSLN